MAPKNNGKEWTKEDISILKNLSKGNTPTRVMGIKLGRSPEAIYSKASQLGVNLKPVNQSPYGTKKK